MMAAYLGLIANEVLTQVPKQSVFKEWSVQLSKRMLEHASTITEGIYGGEEQVLLCAWRHQWSRQFSHQREVHLAPCAHHPNLNFQIKHRNPELSLQPHQVR
jgi:hypothetical protein